MQKKIYDKKLFNKLLVVKKPIYMSSNSYLNRIKRKYKSKKAGFSGTLDPFAKGCLIVAFGQYSKLFKYLKKVPKTYRATIWLGAQSESLDIENIKSIEDTNILTIEKIQEAITSTSGEISYVPPKFSAKKVDGQRAYDLARKGETVELKTSNMNIFDSKFISYSHPFITFEATVSEGSYIRSLAQIILEKLGIKGTLSYLERLNEGEFFFENEKSLNPLDFLDLPFIEYSGDKKWVEDGKKINIDFLNSTDDGKYILKFDDFFSILEIVDSEVKYILNKVMLHD